MKIADGFAIKEMGGTYVALYVGEGEDPLSGMVQLNETAAFLWKLLEKGSTEDALVSALLDEYNIDEATAKKDVNATIETLKQSNLVV